MEADRIAFDEETQALVVDVSCTGTYCGNPMRVFIPKSEILEAWNARQPEVVSRDAIHKVVGDIVDGEEMWSAYDIAQAIHALLTKGRGGA